MPLQVISQDLNPAKVMADTWGHLRAQPGRYPCTLIVAVGLRSATLVDYDIQLCDSPWLAEDLHAFIMGLPGDMPDGIYIFTGIYRVFKTLDTGRFTGKHRHITLDKLKGIVCR